jgi:hypothetical protein
VQKPKFAQSIKNKILLTPLKKKFFLVGSGLVSIITGFATLTDSLDKLPGIEGLKKNIQQSLDIHQITGSEYSEVGVDINYTDLRDTLKRRDFKDANQKTMELIRRAVKKNSDYVLKVKDIDNPDQGFPCKDLQTVNNLWEKYSDKKFGFATQGQVWIDLGGKLGESEFNSEIYEKFGDRLSWKDGTSWKSPLENKFGYDINQPKGHLPKILKSDSPNLEITFADRLNRCASWQ